MVPPLLKKKKKQTEIETKTQNKQRKFKQKTPTKPQTPKSYKHPIYGAEGCSALQAGILETAGKKARCSSGGHLPLKHLERL